MQVSPYSSYISVFKKNQTKPQPKNKRKNTKNPQTFQDLLCKACFSLL